MCLLPHRRRALLKSILWTLPLYTSRLPTRENNETDYLPLKVLATSLLTWARRWDHPSSGFSEGFSLASAAIWGNAATAEALFCPCASVSWPNRRIPGCCICLEPTGHQCIDGRIIPRYYHLIPTYASIRDLRVARILRLSPFCDTLLVQSTQLTFSAGTIRKGFEDKYFLSVFQ